MLRFAAPSLVLLVGAPVLASEPAAGPPSGGTTAVFAAAQAPEQAEVAAAFEAELARALSAEGVPLADLEALFPRDELPPTSARADALVTQGQKLYDQLDGEKAAAKFDEALALYAARPADAPNPMAVRALVFLGAARLLSGDEAGAKQSFVGAVQLDPSFEPGSKLLDGQVLALFEQVKQGLAGQPQATLDVQTVPAGARVRTGAQTLGDAPLRRKVPAGVYLLSLTRPGFEATGAIVRAEPGREGTLRRELEVVPSYAAIREVGEKLARPGPFLQVSLPLEAKAVADRMGVRYLVLAQVTGPASAELQVWDVATGNRLKGLSGNPGAAADALASRVREFQGRPAPLRPGVSAGEPITQKWWFWTGVGAAAVGVTAALLVATQPRPSSGPTASVAP